MLAGETASVPFSSSFSTPNRFIPAHPDPFSSLTPFLLQYLTITPMEEQHEQHLLSKQTHLSNLQISIAHQFGRPVQTNQDILEDWFLHLHPVRKTPPPFSEKRKLLANQVNCGQCRLVGAVRSS
ncbi:MAG: hypothetical protein ACI9G1_000735 [Pirellulaceae bacterium]|jgi:hypothetical protein